MTNKSSVRSDSRLKQLGSAALLASAGIHLDLFITGYRHIPTIGLLFLVQFVAGVTLGFLIFLFENQLLSAMGALFALGTLSGYLLARAVGLFGFHELATASGLIAGLLDITALAALGYIVTSFSQPIGLIRPGMSQIARRINAFSKPTRKAGLPTIIITFLVLVLIGNMGLVGGSSTPSRVSTSSTSHSGGSTLTIDIVNFSFVPGRVTVKPGEKIIVHNKDSVAHTLTAVPGSVPFGNFDTGDIAPSHTATLMAPDKPGTYQYFCSIHNFMTGVITVQSR